MKSPSVVPALPNSPSTREAWLRDATDELRPYFEKSGFPLPTKIRFAIAFTSGGRKGRRTGETWHSDTSSDGNFELIIRADIAEPVEVLGVLVHQLIHAALPITAGHGKEYRDAALKIGLEGNRMRDAMPGPRLQDLLVALAEKLGPLPHARLNIERGPTNKGPIDRPRKQGTRMLKATCKDVSCEYVVRVAATPARLIGPPHCPKHAEMRVEWPENEEIVAGASSNAKAPETVLESV